jgi:hypothetical protein
MEMKINRKDYTITRDDLFLDDGKTVQLLTQSQEKTSGGRKPNPVLGKKNVKELHAAGVRINPSTAYGGMELRLSK